MTKQTMYIFSWFKLTWYPAQYKFKWAPEGKCVLPSLVHNLCYLVLAANQNRTPG